MRKRVWVLYGFTGYRGGRKLALVSKVRWQNVYADYNERKNQGLELYGVEYITESTDKAMLERMRDLTKE